MMIVVTLNERRRELFRLSLLLPKDRILDGQLDQRFPTFFGRVMWWY